MTSAHRSSESAHRSGEPELKTEILTVKTPDDKDAVIVSFVDMGSNESEGIFLYEPGVDPVELSAVGINGVATEFEYATVSGETVDGEEVEFPGDGMVTRAQRDVDVAQVAEDRDNLQHAYDTLREQAEAMREAVRVGHDQRHSGAFTRCDFPECEAARSMAEEL